MPHIPTSQATRVTSELRLDPSQEITSPSQELTVAEPQSIASPSTFLPTVREFVGMQSSTKARNAFTADMGDLESIEDRVSKTRTQAEVASEQRRVEQVDIDKAKREEDAEIEAKEKERAIASARTRGGIESDEFSVLGISDSSGFVFDEPSGLFVPSGAEATSRLRRAVLSGDLAEFSANADTADLIANDPNVQSLIQSFKTQEAELTSDINRLRSAEIDPATLASITRIENTFKQRIEARKDLNRRILASERVRGFRRGTQRFTIGIQEGILAERERQGLDAIARIENERDLLIQEIRADAQQKRFTDVNTKMAKLRELERERIGKVLKLNKDANEELKKEKEKLDAFKKEASVVDILGRGITDPTDIFNELNFDESGNLIGDITTSEIDDILKNVLPDDPATVGDIRQFQDALENKLIPEDTTLFEFLRQRANAKRQIKDVEPLSILDIQRIEQIFGFAVPIGTTQAQVSAVIKANPNATPSELEQALKELRGMARPQATSTPTNLLETDGQVEVPTTDEPFLTREFFKENFSTKELKELSDEAGTSALLRRKKGDIEAFLDLTMPLIEEARKDGHADKAILQFITGTSTPPTPQ